MELVAVVDIMLYVAAGLQVVAAIVAVLLIPESGMRRSWMLICVALIIMAARRVYHSVANPTLIEAASALVVSVLVLAGILGIRHVFRSLRRAERLLDDERERETEFMDRAGAVVVVLDNTGRIVSMNEAACEIVGCARDEFVGGNWFDVFVDAERREGIRRGFLDLMASGDRNDEYMEYVLTDRFGKEHTVVWHRRVLRDASGAATGSRSAGIDITERASLERELAFKSRLLDQTTDAVVVYRPDGTIVYANDTACRYRGRTREELLGTDVRDLMTGDDRPRFELDLHRLRGGSCAIFQVDAVGEGGLVRPLESHACPIDQAGDLLIVDVARDITERRAAEEAMQRMICTDSLTSLPNRVLLYDRAGLAMARARRDGTCLAVCFADLDNLKRVNDTLGHAAGDELLRLAAERLSETFRGEDTVARIGGDEFVIVAQVADGSAAEALAQRVVDLVAEPFEVLGERVSSSVSVGVAVFPRDAEGFDGLVAVADAAMYQAKDAGRGRYVLAASRYRDGSSQATPARG